MMEKPSGQNLNFISLSLVILAKEKNKSKYGEYATLTVRSNNRKIRSDKEE